MSTTPDTGEAAAAAASVAPTRASSSSPIGVVGLGLVGRALVQRLATAGHAVLGFDVRADAGAELLQDAKRRTHGDAEHARAGVAIAPRLSDLRRCETVVLAVFDTAGVLAVLEGEDGLAREGALHHAIDCSTGDADALAALATRLRDAGIGFIEAPLSGSSGRIASGEATMLLGGTDEAVAACAGVLEALSPHRIHVGPAGMGARAKLATNLVLGLNRAVLAEGFAFAEALGIGRERFLDLVLATPARSDAAAAKGPLMVEERFEPPQSRIRQHLKDVRLMLDAAARAGQRLPLSEVHAQLMQAAIAAGDGDLDNAAIVRQLARERVDRTPAWDPSDGTERDPPHPAASQRADKT